ncbi:MAG: hypothetical protein ACRDJM_09600, partial [Actinomycetota bacterium]
SYRPSIGGVPFYVAGGGGRAAELTKLPTSGYYNGWFLVTVRKPAGRPTQVDVKSMPVLDSTALDAFDGTYVKAGNVLRFSAISRMPDGGFSDPDQSKGLYMNLPFAPRCNTGGPGSYNGGCVSHTALLPEFKFSTADSDKARFVAWDSGRDRPARDGDNLVPSDPLSGYLCTFEAGPTTVYVTVGMHRAAYPIYIDGGFGPCVDKPVPPEDIQKPPPPPPPTITEPVPRPQFFFGGSEAQAAIFPPIPAPVVAPAPPGAPGVGRKEEHEVQTETEGHGESQFTALSHRRAVEAAQEQSWAMLAAVAMMAFMGASVAAATRERVRTSEERVPDA